MILYYVTGHFHYVSSMSATFSIFGGIYFWFDKITGVEYFEFLGQMHVRTAFIFTNQVATFYYFFLF